MVRAFQQSFKLKFLPALNHQAEKIVGEKGEIYDNLFNLFHHFQLRMKHKRFSSWRKILEKVLFLFCFCLKFQNLKLLDRVVGKKWEIKPLINSVKTIYHLNTIINCSSWEIYYVNQPPILRARHDICEANT